MKDLKGIMMEMNNLSEQIAITLNNEEAVKSTTAQADTSVPPSYASTQSTYASITPTSRNVPFCCAINLPANFVPTLTTKIIYDLDCFFFIFIKQ